MTREMISQYYSKHSIFPIISQMKYLEEALNCPNADVIILSNMLNVLNVKRVVQKVRDAGKAAIVDLDLVAGLNTDDYAVNYLIKEAGVDGLITRQRGVITYAKRHKVWTIFKIFASDMLSVESALNHIHQCSPDALDILPGVAAPAALPSLRKGTDIPIGVSGFIAEPEKGEYAVPHLFKAGVSVIHTRERALWGTDWNSNIPE